jgi:GMP reductase
MENVFDYEDVQLIPAKCIVSSRSECDTSVVFGGRRFRLPVVPSNMQTIIDEKIALYLAYHGYFYIMHRFEPQKRKAFIDTMHARALYSSVSVGVRESEFQFIEELAEEKRIPEYITIDIAHGHSDTVIRMIHHIKRLLPETFIIAGNVGTPEAVRELENAGADATKVGIGPGKVCITKIKTGFGTGGWQLSALRWCSKAASKPIIADGGIRTHGDIAKSIRFGAAMVMIGSLFAGHEESPGQTIEMDGKPYKEYFGSASEFQKGENRNIEGKRMYVEFRGPLKNTLEEMEQDMQSSVSYAGGKKLDAIRNVDYVVVKSSIFNGDRVY